MSLTPRCYIWVITIFLFSCILSGGTLLVLYMLTQPETPTTSWYPVIGIVLVCLPWFFWLLTVLYRILSRTLGFRMVCWGKSAFPVNGSRCGDTEAANDNNNNNNGGAGGDALESGNTAANDNPAAAMVSPREQSSKQAQFGDSVAPRGSSKASSHESELPLRASMAS